MARIVQSTRSRRALMQGIMWAILGGTVGLAAVVRHLKYKPIELGAPVQWGRLTVRVPMGWAVRQETAMLSLPPAPRTITATEPQTDEDEPGRVVTITQQFVGSGVTPAAYLTLLRGVAIVQSEAYAFAGAAGIKALERVNVPVADGEYMRGYSLWAAIVAPPGWAIAVRLTAPGKPGPEDEKLLERLAESITINPPDPADDAMIR